MYAFDEYKDRQEYCTAALLVYAVWMSRDRARYKITPDVWAQVRRFVQAAAKRAETVPEFLERLMPRLCCGAINARALDIGVTGAAYYITNPDTGEVLSYARDAETRTHLSDVLRDVDEDAVLRILRDETQYIVDLVQARRDRERPVAEAIERAVVGDEETAGAA